MKSLLSPGLVLALGLFLAIAPAHGQRPSSSPLFRTPVDSRFDSDVSQFPRSREYWPRGIYYSRPGSPGAVFDIPRMPSPEPQTDELLPPPSPSPSLSPLPSASPTQSPTPEDSPSPTPSIAPTVTPVPSAPPTATPIPQSTPAFPVPPPNPAPIVAMPPRPEPAPPSSAPSLLYVQQITPVIEVWRAGAVTPELPPRRGKFVGPIAIPNTEAVIVRLQFGPPATGKSVVVTASGGVILDPPQQVLSIQPSADCAVSVGLSDEYSNGAIRFYCEGLSTTLILSRFVPETQPLSQGTSNGARR